MIDKLVLALVVIGALELGQHRAFPNLIWWQLCLAGRRQSSAALSTRWLRWLGSGPFPFSSVTRLHTIRQQGNDIVKIKDRKNFSGPFAVIVLFACTAYF